MKDNCFRDTQAQVFAPISPLKATQLSEYYTQNTLEALGVGVGRPEGFKTKALRNNNVESSWFFF